MSGVILVTVRVDVRGQERRVGQDMRVPSSQRWWPSPAERGGTERFRKEKEVTQQEGAMERRGQSQLLMLV